MGCMRRAMARDTALRLANFLGTSAEFWLNVQSLYGLRLAQQKPGKSIKDLPILKRSKSYRKVGFATAFQEHLPSGSGQEG
jgi:plasmid maintenance system antidote protein VapI